MFSNDYHDLKWQYSTIKQHETEREREKEREREREREREV